MALNWNESSASEYKHLRFDMVRSVEGLRRLPYFDSADDPNPTIGVGFNLRVDNVRRAVFEELGIEASDLRKALTRVIDNRSITTDAELQQHLNDALQDWTADHPESALQEFAFADGQAGIAQAKAVFDAIDDTYEDAINDWLSDIPPSHERAVLYSLAYNNASELLGPGIHDAIVSGDRAEAWFQIRYYSNGDDDPGIAKRRYVESELFGLYAEGVTAETITEAQAREVYRMYTHWREQILSYEADYGAGAGDYDSGDETGNMIAYANADGALVGLTGGVRTLEESFAPAYGYLVEEYAEALQAGLGETIDYRNILIDGEGEASRPIRCRGRDGWALGSADAAAPDQVSELVLAGDGADRIESHGGNDILWGEAGSDTLQGGAGDDWLVGGIGTDRLSGGTGKDTYVFRAGDGHDVITDSDGLGELRIDGAALTGSIEAAYRKDGVTVWESADGRYVYKLSEGNLIDGGRLTITGKALEAGDEIAIEDFRNGDLGIELSAERRIALLAGVEANPFDADGYTPQSAPVELREQPGTVPIVFRFAGNGMTTDGFDSHNCQYEPDTSRMSCALCSPPSPQNRQYLVPAPAHKGYWNTGHTRPLVHSRPHWSES